MVARGAILLRFPDPGRKLVAFFISGVGEKCEERLDVELLCCSVRPIENRVKVVTGSFVSADGGSSAVSPHF
jgi:hypothetical protein